MKKILICSGKGGVGKTTISVAIANMLKNAGFKVGLLDVDVDTPNITEFMNITEREVELTSGKIMPKFVDEIEVMSIGLIADTDMAVMWDGERRAMAIEQMINKVEWGCDVLVIDSPPGTTDEVMTVIKNFNPDGIIVVTTGHKASISDVKRTLAMIKMLDADKKLLGIIKNMTYYICTNCGEKHVLFDDIKDKDVEKRVIAEIPYSSDSITDYLSETIDKVIEVI